MYPPKADTAIINEYSPEELVDKALKTLQDAGIQLIEWLSLLHRRMNVPVIIKDFHYLVPDEQLDIASELLARVGYLPRSRPPPFLVRTGGDFYTKARMFRVTQYTSLALAQHLVLYPASLAAYSPLDLSPAPRTTSLSQPLCKTVLVPSQAAVYSSILRSMQRYSRFDSARIFLQSDLSQLVDYNLYGLDCGYIDTDDDELCEELEVDRRVKDATSLVEEWRCTGALRDQAIGDALVNVVSGRWTVEDVPWRR
ncbi:hypothetical protein LXA43DRAFT_877825 [Ganoderma leucocontextum]|nr:hypothetical protein LXA43DRAFT_877825 [Ganoderma leucocontextum]